MSCTVRLQGHEVEIKILLKFEWFIAIQPSSPPGSDFMSFQKIWVQRKNPYAKNVILKDISRMQPNLNTFNLFDVNIFVKMTVSLNSEMNTFIQSDNKEISTTQNYSS